MLRFIYACCAFLAAYTPSAAKEASFWARENAAWMRGARDFCKMLPHQCEASSSTEIILATPERLAEIDAVNRLVNTTITFETDLNQYRIREYWTLPVSGSGDCEDFALQKRDILHKLGWPHSALLITIVRTAQNELHAVLMVRLSSGDFILDSATDRIALRREMPYRFLKHQSMKDPTQWLSFGRVTRTVSRTKVSSWPP